MYSRYRAEIPKPLLVLYFLILIIHTTGIIVCFFLYIIQLPQNVGGTLVMIVIVFDVVWTMLIALLFWSPGSDFAYGRWISRKKGQDRKHK